ncbi:APC family permease [Diaminobutyricimonas sp. LJ205]|uniref:APC family permease n=1 Tax=Diaminobutyricimonas sp. LJ205 TaxID=2683590 RepID=UPI0018DFBF5E|nr:amino acid permease [Diaminobutyricimonas sp. LJ205]
MQLQRHLGTGHAIAIGLASMMGAGVFFVWAPAAEVAGNGLLIGLVLAGVIATLNALSSAQLAMRHPVSGGTYAYGRAELGPWWGFAAGWLFLAGKTASAGAIALIAGSYLWPEYARAVAVAAIVLFATLNAAGIRSTARVSTVIVTIVLAGLAFIVVSVLGQGSVPTPALPDLDAGWYGVLQSAGLIFFAFAGYARMATLGEEVRDPRRTLPRAIIGALAIALVVYGIVGWLSLSVLGAEQLAASDSPLADLVGSGWEVPVRLLAALACLGSLMGILAGLSRTSLAMAGQRDLPGPLARVSQRTHAPIVAEVTVAVIAIVGVIVLEPARLVAFSSCAVLVYYAIAHLSALRQTEGAWLPRAVQVAGIIGCFVLAFTLPWQAIVGAAGVLLLGVVARALSLRARSPRS